jgi:hypothetical protein
MDPGKVPEQTKKEERRKTMSKRKMFRLAIGLILLLALVGGSVGVWAADASNEQEDLPSQGKQDERKEEEVPPPEVPEKWILRWDEFDIRHLPYDERTFKQIYPPEDAYIDLLPPELAHEYIVVKHQGSPQEQEVPPVAADPRRFFFRWEHEIDELETLEGRVLELEETPDGEKILRIQDMPDEERPFKHLTQ